MSVSTLEHRQVMGSMSQVRETADTGGGEKQGVGLVLQGGDTGSPSVCSGVLGYVIHDNEDDGVHPCGVPTKNHGEAGNVEDQWFMRDTGDQGSTTCGRNAVGGHIHRPPTGDDNTVGGPTTIPGGLCA